MNLFHAAGLFLYRSFSITHEQIKKPVIFGFVGGGVTERAQQYEIV